MGTSTSWLLHHMYIHVYVSFLMRCVSYDWIAKSTTLHFTGSTTFSPETDVFADEPIVISIINDESAEGIESLICSLQVGVVQSVRTVDPKQVTIVINDDDGKEGSIHG